jgi:hypothetical protein
LNVSSHDRVRRLLKEGWHLLSTGRSRDAGFAFGRILLRDPQHAEARRGLARASAADDETRRAHEARLDEAHRALAAGDAERSRHLLETLAAGDERERALELLDRLDGREGRIGASPRAGAPPADAWQSGAVARPAWLRRALLACWSLLLIATGAGLAGSWSRIVGGLLEAPVPDARRAPALREVAPGERALERASRLLAQGDAAGAVEVLSDVPADDPAYPFSVRLRLEAQAALAGPGPHR